MDDFLVNLASGGCFTARPDENLLTAAQRAQWLVRYGCRNGNCEACAATLLNGSVLQAGIGINAESIARPILLCLCRATSDLRIALPGNPQHGSREQARRYYARVAHCKSANTQNIAKSIVHLTLPAGRLPPLYPGQYALLECDDGLMRAEIDTVTSIGRELYLHCAARLTLNINHHIGVICPLGYCYAATTKPVFILHDQQQRMQAELLQQALPAASILDTAQLDRLTNSSGSSDSVVLACTQYPQLAETWYRQLLPKFGFSEFRSDSAIWYRWQVCRQDDNGNRFIVATTLSEQEARQQVLALEQRGHKQVYWAEPMAVRSEL